MAPRYLVRWLFLLRWRLRVRARRHDLWRRAAHVSGLSRQWLLPIDVKGKVSSVES
jgi:hypothetical protein